MSNRLDLPTIANRALARLGEGPISSLDDETDLARQVNAVLFDVVDAIGASHAWSFGRRTYRLDEAANVDTNGWKFAHHLPERLSYPVKVAAGSRAPDAPLRDFAIEGRFLMADFSPVWATFQDFTDPELWPPAFRMAVVTALAAHLAIPVTHDRMLKDALWDEAYGPPQMMMRGGCVGAAIAAEMAAGSNRAPLLISSPLIDARED